MRHYETIYIINPELVEEDYRAVVRKFADLVPKYQGVPVKLEEWGKQRLAYLVRKFDKGFYVLMEYCGLPGLIAEIEREFKLDDRVLKYQTVKLADYVDPQELVLRHKESEKQDEVPASEQGEESKVSPETRAQDEGVEHGV